MGKEEDNVIAIGYGDFQRNINKEAIRENIQENMQENDKELDSIEKKCKKRQKRSIEIEDGVGGTELHLYLKNVKKPEIKITFLHKNKKIYKDVIRIYIADEHIHNFDILNICNLLYYAIIENRIKKESEIYQAIAMVSGRKQVRDYGIRHYWANPYFQATYGFKGYSRFSHKIKQEFFEKPLLEKSKKIKKELGEINE
jgi:hypothetical protein